MLRDFLTAATSVAPVLVVLAIMGVSACAAFRPISETSDISPKE